jgi:molybdate transport system ATP-binding protein
MRDVSVNYGDHRVLSGVDWTVRTGENWALVGPNGAGKSTLLRLITGDHLQGYANELTIFGRRKGSGESIWELKQQIGYVSEDIQLRYQKKMSGFDVVCSGFFDSVGLYRHCSPAQKRAAQGWLDKTGTADLARRRFTELSFGQQRMILMVRALVKSPRLLILDEPCNGLDPANRQRLLGMLDVIGSSGATHLLYVSHRPSEIPSCITHQLIIDAGRVVKKGPIS